MTTNAIRAALIALGTIPDVPPERMTRREVAAMRQASLDAIAILEPHAGIPPSRRDGVATSEGTGNTTLHYRTGGIPVFIVTLPGKDALLDALAAIATGTPDPDAKKLLDAMYELAHHAGHELVLKVGG